VLRDVRERLRAEEVRDRLDLRRQPGVRNYDLDAHRRLLCERREGGGEPFFGEDTGVESVSEPAELLERPRELSLAPVDPIPGRLVAGGEARLPKLPTDPNQRPLGTFEEPPLEAPPCLVGRFEDPSPRFPELDHPGAHLGLEPRVRGRELGRGRDGLAESRILEHIRVMDERGNRPASALDDGDRAIGPGPGPDERATLGVDEGISVRKRVADLEGRVAERTGELVSERIRAALAELDDEVGCHRPLPRGREEPGEEPAGDGTEGRLEREERRLIHASGGRRKSSRCTPCEDEAQAGGSLQSQKASPAGWAECLSVGTNADGDQEDGEGDRGDLALPDRSEDSRRVSDRNGSPLETGGEAAGRVGDKKLEQRPPVEEEGVSREPVHRGNPEGVEVPEEPAEAGRRHERAALAAGAP
jgi:hypothetical protein